MALSIVFMGTPEFAVPTLARLAGDGHRVRAVYTQPPRPGGRRGLKTIKSPVHQQAEILGIEVRTPQNFRAREDIDALAALKPDVIVVVAYGLLLPQAVLDIPHLGCFNGHASLLPRWRGAAPIQRAIMAGDENTGMMVMQMEAGLDTGPVAMTQTVEIGPDMSAGELHDRLMVVGGGLMGKAMKALEDDTLTLTPQAAEGITYASKIDKAESRIDFSLPAGTVHNLIRGLSPFPGAWLEAKIDGKPERIKVLRSAVSTMEGEPGRVLDDAPTVACGTGSVRLLRLQRAGGKPLDASEFQRGRGLVPGSDLA